MPVNVFFCAKLYGLFRLEIKGRIQFDEETMRPRGEIVNRALETEVADVMNHLTRCMEH